MSSAKCADAGSDIPPNSHWVTTEQGHHILIDDSSGDIVSRGKASAAIKKAIHRITAPSIREDTDEYNTPSWNKARSAMKELGESDGYLAVVAATTVANARAFRNLSDEEKLARAHQTIATVASYLSQFGRQTNIRMYAEMAQKNLREMFPQLAQVYPQFFAPDFVDRELAIYERRAMNFRKAKAKIDELNKRSKELSSVSEAKALLEEVNNTIASVGETQLLRDAKARAMKVTRGGLPEVDTSSNPVELGSPIFPSSLDELTEVNTPASFAAGNTKPRLMVDGAGKKWVLKSGGTPGHAKAEWECSEAYRALGIRAPASKMYGTMRLAEYIDGTNFGEAYARASEEQRKAWMNELRDGFAADVVLGNHDVLGDDLDNVMIGSDGHVWRVDCGGALGLDSTGKKNDGFDSGWIDDLWEMRGLSPNLGQERNNKESNLAKYFGDISTHELLMRADSMPWEKAIKHLEESEYENPQYSGDRMFRGQRSRTKLGRKDILKQRIGEVRNLAATSRSVVTDGNYSHDTNESLLRYTYALSKTAFRELAGFKQPNGTPMFYSTTMTGWANHPFDGQLKSIHHPTSLLSDSLTINNKSLNSIISDVAKSAGIDMSSGFGDQGEHQSAVELAGMGRDIGRVASGDVGDTPIHLRRDVMTAAAILKSNPQEWNRVRESSLLRKAATMLFMRYSGLPNFDPKTNRLLVLRTEHPAVIGRDAINQEGMVLDAFPRAPHSSASWFQTFAPDDDNHVIAMSVPMSRISSCDIFQKINPYNPISRRDGSVGVNASGLPFVYLGTVNQETPIREYFKLIADAERRSGRTLDGREFRTTSEYNRISSPWAKED